jgi:microcystin-dependent protein
MTLVGENLESGPYYLDGRYIMIGRFPKIQRIVGRVYGGDGSATYQLAARPYDECPVHSHQNIEVAFQAAVAELNRRVGL